MQFKLSHYAILSDPFEPEDVPEGKRLAFSARLAQTLVLNNDILNKIQARRWEEIDDSILNELIETELIVPDDDNELHTVLRRNNAAIDDEQTLAFVIQPTAQCQLGCGYCGQQHSKDSLSETLYEKILERLRSKYRNNRPYRHQQIYWFGAEPLLGLRHIRALTPELRQIAAENNCSYAAKIVTNGLSLKENIFLELVELGVNAFEITLDGTADYHDMRRYTKEGIHTFDIIFNNLLSIVSLENFSNLNVQITIRCNVDERNHEGVMPLIELLTTNNMIDKVGFYVAPIHSWGNDAHKKSLTPEEFADKEVDWLIELSQHTHAKSYMPVLKRVTCLALTHDGELVDAFGNFYNCTEISYVPAYQGTELILGNLNNDTAPFTGKKPFADFNQQVQSGTLPCSACQILPVCGGSCPKSWHEGNPPCPSFKYNIKERMTLTYIKMRADIKELVN